MQLPQPGDVFQQKYKLLDVLGQGGFAVVFRARQIDVGRDVAIKVLVPRQGGYAGGLAGRFMREAKLIGTLRDPHTLTMYDFGHSESGLLYMVTEFVEGTSLDELVAGGPVPSRAALHIIRQVATSLREAHQHGILHRDIKPANIMVFEYMGDPYCAKLLDFGIAKVAAGGGVELTAEGAIVGTPRYMSPEQLAAEELGPPTDIYSLGLVLWELLFGERAVSAETTRDVMRTHLDDTPHAIRSSTPAALRDLLDRMVAKRAGARFQTVQELLAAIEAVPAEQLTDELEATKPLVGVDAALAPTATGISPSGGEPTVTEPRPERSGDSRASDRHGDRNVSDDSEASRLTTWGVGALTVAGLLAVGGLLWTSQDDGARPTDADAGAVVDASVLETAPDTGSPRDSGPVDAVILSGCGNAASRGWKTTRRGTAEHYEVFVPSSYDADARAPVLLWFHPQLLDGQESARSLGIEALAEARGALIVAPRSRRATPWFRDMPAESERAQRTLRQIQEDYCVDNEAVFAVGFSLGSRMARTVTCAAPELFRGVALLGYAPHEADSSCFPEPPMATFVLSIDEDPYVPPDGRRGCWRSEVSPLEPYLERLRASQTCDGEDLYFADDEGSCSTFGCDAMHLECVVKSDVHHWPGSEFVLTCPREKGLSFETTSFPATDLLGRFIDEASR